MKILFILEHYYPYVGGAEQLFKSVAEGLAAKGHEVCILTTLYDKNLPELESINKVEIHRINCLNRFLFTVLAIPSAIKMAGETDLIFTTSYTAAFPSWVAGIVCQKKRIIVFHEVWNRLWWQLPYLGFMQRLSFYLFEKFILKLSFDQFIAVSDFTKKCLVENGVKKEKITRIYNGLEPSDFEGFEHQKPEPFTAIYLGRLGVSKGLDLLIPAAGKFAKNHSDSLFKFVLPTRPRPFLYKIKKELKEVGLLDNNLLILHELTRQELFNEIVKSTCVVVPSYSEGFGFVAAEAIALKMPLISSQKGALKEVVTGKFVAMKSHTIEGLLEAFEKANKEDWETTEVKEFSFQKTINQYLNLIETIHK